MQDQPCDLVDGQVLEAVWQPVRQELKENDAEGIDIRALVENGGVGGDLLRAHVTQRAEKLAGLGSARGRAACRRR